MEELEVELEQEEELETEEETIRDKLIIYGLVVLILLLPFMIISVLVQESVHNFVGRILIWRQKRA